MTVLPTRSPGVLLAALGDRHVAYDLVTETLHHLNRSAGTILATCDGRADRAWTVDAWAGETGTDPQRIETDLETILDRFAALGLIERTVPFIPPLPRTGSPQGIKPGDGARTGLVHPILHRRVRFRSSDPALLDTVDRFLGTGHPDPTETDPLDRGSAPGSAGPGQDASAEPPLILDLEALDGVGIRLRADTDWDFPTRDSLLDRIVSVLNEFAVENDHVLTLHAGAARSPDGRVVLPPAASGSGKSTLTAALVRTGWDYLGDEAIGIDPAGIAIGYPKRLALGPTSRRTVGLAHDRTRDVDPAQLDPEVRRLAGPVGKITDIVFPDHQPDTTPEFERLDPFEAFDELLANTLNLARIGQPGLETLCHLALTVPARHLVHHDALIAAELIDETIRARSEPPIR